LAPSVRKGHIRCLRSRRPLALTGLLALALLGSSLAWAATANPCRGLEHAGWKVRPRTDFKLGSQHDFVYRSQLPRSAVQRRVVGFDPHHNADQPEVLLYFLGRMFALVGLFVWCTNTSAALADEELAVAVASASIQQSALGNAAVAMAVAVGSNQKATDPSDEEPILSEEELPLPNAPGMDEANLIVNVETDPKYEEAVSSQAAGVQRLMACPRHKILGLMARDGWQVHPIDKSEGLFELVLPPVEYNLPLAVVSIPAPRFKATVTSSQKEAGKYKERLIGDLVLLNGDDILSVDLKFPFSRTFSVSASGWARCRVGQEENAVRMSADVQIGLQMPQIPGLKSIMQYFVSSYANQSTSDCARALARGADEVSSPDECH